MADQKRASGTGDGPRRQRPAPTIDLTATDVTPPQDQAAAAQPDAGKSGTDKPDTDKPDSAQPDSKQPETKTAASSAGETPTREFLSQAERTGGGDGGSGTVKPAFRLPYIFAGLAGGGLVAAVLFVLWLTGTVPIRYAGSTAMRARVSGLEMQVHGLTDQLAKRAPSTDSKTLDELGTRIGKAEQAIAGLPAGTDRALTDRVATTENALKAVGVALSALNTRVEQLASTVRDAAQATGKSDPAALTELRRSLAALQAETRGLQDHLNAIAQAGKATQDQVAQNTGADRAARLAIAAAALRDAVARGDPYAAQLDAVKALGAEAGALAPLAAFAQTGVPNDTVLSAELRALLPGMVKAAGTGSPGAQGFLDRLQANAEKLVRVRPVDAPSGRDSGALLARLDVMTAHHDVAGARAELDKLPPPLRAQADAWAEKVAARQAAIDASRKLAADAARALGQSPGNPTGKS